MAIKLVSPVNKLVVNGSGGTLLDVQGSEGQLFSITDSLTGDLFAVSDISGIPILNVNSSGAVDIDGTLNLGDNDKIQLGASQDLRIYHDGTHSYIDGITNDLYIRTVTPGDDIVVQAYDDLFLYTNNGLDAIIARGGGGVEAYYNNSKKFETTNTGVTVTGNVGMATGHSSGKFAVMSTSVHASYDFYNNGSTYLNGATTIDAAFTQTGNAASTFSGTIAASNLSGTNTGDQTLPTLSSLGALSTTGKAADSNLLDGIDSSGFVRKYTFTPGAGNTGRRYIKLFTLDNYDDGVTGILSAAGDYGDADKASYEIQIGTRTSISFDVYQTSHSAVSDDYEFYYHQAENDDYEIWALMSDYNQNNQFTVLSQFGTVTYNFDSVTTTEPSGLTQVTKHTMYHSGNLTPLTIGTTATTAMAGNTSLFDGAYGSLSGLPTLGTAAATASTAYATSAQGTLATNALPKAGGTMTGNVIFNDSKELRLGTSSDFKGFHNGTNTHLSNYTGQFVIENYSDDKDILFASDDGSGGITTYMFLDGSQTNVNFQKDAIWADGKKALFGGSGDLQIYHDGANSYVADTGTGNMYLNAADNMYFQVYATGERWITLTKDAGVQLYHNDVEKFQTQSTGTKTYGVHSIESSGIALDIENSSASGADTGIRIRGARNGQNFGTNVLTSYALFSNYDNNSTPNSYDLAQIGAGMYDSDSDTGYFRIETNNGTALTKAFDIDKNQDAKFYGDVDSDGDITASNLSGTNTGDQDLSSYAPLASPALTGTPTAPTAGATINTTQLATTAFVQTAISNLADSAPATLNTLNELAAALGDDASFSTTVTNSIATKLPLAGGTLTGTLVAPTIKLALDTGNNVNSRVTVYESGATSYGMMLWNDNATSGNWSTMIYGPNQSDRKISFGKANSNFPGTKASVDELAYVDLDNGNFVATGTLSGTNFSGSSSGTNTGDQTLPTASSLGAVTLTGTQTITGKKNFGTIEPSLIKDSLYYNAESTNWRTQKYIRSVGITGGSIGDSWVQLSRVVISSTYEKVTIKFTINGYDDVSSGVEAIDVRYENGSTAQENHQCAWYSTDDHANLFKDVRSIRSASNGLSNTYDLYVQMAGDWRDSFTVVAESWTTHGDNASIVYSTAAGTATEPTAGDDDLNRGERRWYTENSYMYLGGNRVYTTGDFTNNASNWNTAYGWGDHGLSAQDKTDISNLSGTNTGDQTLPTLSSLGALSTTGKAADSELLDGIDSSAFLRSNASDSFSGILTGTSAGENLKVGGIRGTTKGSQAGEYIHLYERVHIGGPSGWGNAQHTAPSQGLGIHGGLNVGQNGSGVISMDDTTIVTAARALTNVTNTNWDTAHGWGNHASAGYITNNISTGLTINGEQSRGNYTAASNYKTGADNIVLKGNSVGRSGIFFESEKDGTNINHSSDFGFIQFHSYGTGTTGESNELIIGVSNDTDDHLVFNAPNIDGMKFRVGASTTDNTVYHSGNLTVGDGELTQKNFTTTLKNKLDGIAASANNYSHPTTAGNKHVPTGGAAGQFLKYSSSGTAVWAADNNTTYSTSDFDAAGSAQDVQDNLDTIAGNVAGISNQSNTDVDTGTETIATVSTGTYTAAFFDFVIKNGTNVRAGTVYSCHDGTNVEFTETSTVDLGDTSDVTLSVDKSGTSMRLRATTTSDNWIIKSLVRAI